MTKLIAVLVALAFVFCTDTICSSKEMRDIDFFSEDIMKRYCKKDFLKSLPPKISRDIKNDGNPLTYLQGYRGPEELVTTQSDLNSLVIPPYDGVQEVRYWHGCTKHLHWIPLAGSVAWLIARQTEDTRWRRLFFNAKSGEFQKFVIEDKNWDEKKDRINIENKINFG